VPEAAAAWNLANGAVRKEVKDGKRHKRIVAINPSFTRPKITFAIKIAA
jgi:hypothetical protein